MTTQKTPTDIKELVIARLDTMPDNIKIAIGNFGSFSKEQLKDHINKDDEIGKKIVEMQMSFIRAVAKGLVYK